jgi:hypothetical protein
MDELTVLDKALLVLGKRIHRVSDGTETDFIVWDKCHSKFIPISVPSNSVVPYTLSFTYRNGKFEILRIVDNVIIDTQ